MSEAGAAMVKEGEEELRHIGAQKEEVGSEDDDGKFMQALGKAGSAAHKMIRAGHRLKAQAAGHNDELKTRIKSEAGASKNAEESAGERPNGRSGERDGFFLITVMGHLCFAGFRSPDPLGQLFL